MIWSYVLNNTASKNKEEQEISNLIRQSIKKNCKIIQLCHIYWPTLTSRGQPLFLAIAPISDTGWARSGVKGPLIWGFNCYRRRETRHSKGHNLGCLCIYAINIVFLRRNADNHNHMIQNKTKQKCVTTWEVGAVVFLVDTTWNHPRKAFTQHKLYLVGQWSWICTFLLYCPTSAPRSFIKLMNVSVSRFLGWNASLNIAHIFQQQGASKYNQIIYFIT